MSILNLDQLLACEGEYGGITMAHPEIGADVLALHKDEWRVLAIEWDNPSYEDIYQAYPYWYDPNNDSDIIEWDDVTYWMPLPEKPTRSRAFTIWTL